MPNNFKDLADQLRRIDYEARSRNKISGEMAIWLTETIRTLEQECEDQRMAAETLRIKHEQLYDELCKLRLSHSQWESQVWALTDAFREALERSEKDLALLNNMVQTVLSYYMSGLENPSDPHQTQNTLLEIGDLETLSEVSDVIMERQLKGHYQPHPDDDTPTETFEVSEPTLNDLPDTSLGELSFSSIGVPLGDDLDLPTLKKGAKKATRFHIFHAKKI